MQIHSNLRVIVSLLTVMLFLPGLSAQTNLTNPPNPLAPQPPPQPPGPPGPGPGSGPFGNLTLAEKMKLKAAHDKAMQMDPTLNQKIESLRQAMDALRKEMHDDMLKADPSVGPIMDKMAPFKHGWGPGPSPEKPMNTPGMTNSGAMNPQFAGMRGMIPPGFASLTPAEQQQLMSLHQQVEKDPSVMAARAAMQQATTPQDRRAAFAAFLKAMHDAMIKADPAIEPVLQKLYPQGPSGPSQQDFLPPQ